jgi:hypothetical protein
LEKEKKERREFSRRQKREEEEENATAFTRTLTHLHTQNHGRRIENEENADETPGPTKLEEVEREGEED